MAEEAPMKGKTKWRVVAPTVLLAGLALLGLILEDAGILLPGDVQRLVSRLLAVLAALPSGS